MKKKLILIMTALCIVTLSSCGSSSGGDDGSGHMYSLCLNGNPQSLDPQFADDSSSDTVIANMYSGLLKTDATGAIVCDNAESYDISQDGLKYTFKLRHDNYWFNDKNHNDCADEGEYFTVTADDYVFAFNRLLSPETQAPHADNFVCIKGASDMLQGKSDKLVGVTSADAYTLVFTLEYADADFLNLLTTSAAMPCNEEFFYGTKGRYGLDDKSVMSNGSFFVRQWFYDPYGSHNILYMKKNSVNNDNDEAYPSYLSFDIEKNSSDIEKSFKAGDVDCMTSMNFSKSYNKRKFSYIKSQSLTLGLIFNKNDKVYSNQNLRKAIALSIDRNELSKEIDDDLSPAYGLVPDAIKLLGRSYRELCTDSGMSVCDKNAAVKCLEKAKEEIGAQSFPTVKILVSADTVNSDYIHLVSQQLQDTLGYYIGVEEVTTNEFKTRISSGDYSVALYPVTADYNSGVSFLKQFKDECIGISEKTGQAIDKLDHIENSSDYVGNFSSTEKMILDEYCYVPIFYKNTYLVCKKENKDMLYDPFSGAVNYQNAKNFG